MAKKAKKSPARTKQSKQAVEIIGEFKIAKLKLAAGDILVVKSKTRLTVEHVNQVSRIIGEKLPAGAKFLILDDGFDLSVMTRAEIEAKTISSPPAAPTGDTSEVTTEPKQAA